jgi:hypothetical protein
LRRECSPRFYALTAAKARAIAVPFCSFLTPLTLTQGGLPTAADSRTGGAQTVDDVLGFIGRGRRVAIHPAYGQGDWLEKVLAPTATHLAQSATMAIGRTGALDAYEGLHSIPLMTIHESKGLECHT